MFDYESSSLSAKELVGTSNSQLQRGHLTKNCCLYGTVESMWVRELHVWYLFESLLFVPHAFKVVWSVSYFCRGYVVLQPVWQALIGLLSKSTKIELLSGLNQ